ncbi:MAG: hypothetical protein AAF411_07290 [Myxococcota bacterium]
MGTDAGYVYYFVAACMFAACVSTPESRPAPQPTAGAEAGEANEATNTQAAPEALSDPCRGEALDYGVVREVCAVDPADVVRPDDPVNEQQVLRTQGPVPDGGPGENYAATVRLDGDEAAVSAIRSRRTNEDADLRLEAVGPREVRSGEYLDLELQIVNVSSEPQERVLTGCIRNPTGGLCSGDTLTRVTLAPGGVLRWGRETWTAAIYPRMTQLGAFPEPEPLALGAHAPRFSVMLGDSHVSVEVPVTVTENPAHVEERLLELALHNYLVDPGARLEVALRVLRSPAVRTEDETVRQVESNCRRAFLIGTLEGEQVRNPGELDRRVAGLDACSLALLPLIDGRGLRPELQRRINARNAEGGPVFGVEGCHLVGEHEMIVPPRPRRATRLAAPEGHAPDEGGWEAHHAGVVVRVDQRGRASRVGEGYGPESLADACWRAADARFTPARYTLGRQAAVTYCFVAQCEF